MRSFEMLTAVENEYWAGSCSRCRSGHSVGMVERLELRAVETKALQIVTKWSQKRGARNTLELEQAGVVPVEG